MNRKAFGTSFLYWVDFTTKDCPRLAPRFLRFTPRIDPKVCSNFQVPRFVNSPPRLAQKRCYQECDKCVIELSYNMLFREVLYSGRFKNNWKMWLPHIIHENCLWNDSLQLSSILLLLCARMWLVITTACSNRGSGHFLLWRTSIFSRIHDRKASEHVATEPWIVLREAYYYTTMDCFIYNVRFFFHFVFCMFVCFN